MPVYTARMTRAEVEQTIADRFGVGRDQVNLVIFAAQEDVPESIEAIVTLPEPKNDRKG